MEQKDRGRGSVEPQGPNFLRRKSIQVYHHEPEHANSVIKNRLAKCEEEEEHLEKEILKLINNSSRENKENHYRDRGLDM